MRWSGYPPRTRVFHWILASFLLILVGISAFVILGACGVLSPLSTWWIPGCQTAVADVPDPRLEAALGRQAILESQVTDLETRLARLECPPARPPPPEPEPEPQGGMDAEQWEEQDIQMLEGCWQLDSHYQTQDVRTGEVSTVSGWNMCFEADGVGSQNLQFDDGRTCRSGTTARFNAAGQLEIRDNSNVNCSDQSYIYRRVMTCDLQPDGTASCLSRQPSREGGSSHVRIRAR